MINDKIMKQEGAEGSTNNQAQVINNYYYGLTNAQVLDILKEDATANAQARKDEFDEALLSVLRNYYPELLEAFRQPALQDALFISQKGYAKSGDKDMIDLLIDILIDRASAPQRTIYQIELDKALLVISQLTIEQIDILTLMFIFKEVLKENFVIQEVNLESFAKLINTIIIPFLSSIPANIELLDNKAIYNHLEDLGCGRYRNLESFAQVFYSVDEFIRQYAGFLQIGFDKDEFEQKIGDEFDNYKFIITNSLHNPGKFQFDAVNLTALKEKISKIPEPTAGRIRAFYQLCTMSPDQYKLYIATINPKMKNEAFNLWHNPLFSHMEMTSVGIIIAHANFKRRTNISLDLSKWIN